MDALTPQLLDAMPLHMGAPDARHRSGASVIREPMFKVMGPMMPVLFPMLLPGMMPKVLPHMIRLVEQHDRDAGLPAQPVAGPVPGGGGQRHAQDAAGDRAEVRADPVRATCAIEFHITLHTGAFES